MQGAREYAKLFDTGQYGQLYIVCDKHARGKTFHIYVLPEGVFAKSGRPWLIKDAVEVYGIISGQPGWTETYGWLHRGEWEKDFKRLVAQRRAEISARIAREQQQKAKAVTAEQDRKAALLANY